MAALSVAIQRRSMARDRPPKHWPLPSNMLIDDQSSNHKSSLLEDESSNEHMKLFKKNSSELSTMVPCGQRAEHLEGGDGGGRGQDMAGEGQWACEVRTLRQ